MKFISSTEVYVEQAVDLVIKSYEIESFKNRSFPKTRNEDFIYCKAYLKDAINYFFKSNMGTIAVTEKGTLAGFIVFPWSKIDGFLGKCFGCFSPLAGNAFCDTTNESDGLTRERVASILLQKEMQKLFESKNTSFAIMLNAHDKEIISAFTLYGFGIRCADAIKLIDLKNNFTGASKENDLTYKIFKLTDLINVKENIKRLQEIYALRRKLEAHLKNSPCFFPCVPLTLEEFIEEEKKRDTTYYTSCNSEGNVVGYITTFKGGENWISDSLCKNGKMIHICGTYVDEEYRGSFVDSSLKKKTSVSEQLVFFIEKTISEQGIKYLGVDCETLNPTALHFWSKHFTNYTYSMQRRIDERCL